MPRLPWLWKPDAAVRRSRKAWSTGIDIQDGAVLDVQGQRDQPVCAGGVVSYDLYLCDPASGETMEVDTPHDVAGGTYALGGTRRAWLNITYNYGKHYYRVFGEKGIRTIYGMTGQASVPILRAAAAQLGDDVAANYWQATEGNAKEALLGLIVLASMCPDGVWEGD